MITRSWFIVDQNCFHLPNSHICCAWLFVENPESYVWLQIYYSLLLEVKVYVGTLNLVEF